MTNATDTTDARPTVRSTTARRFVLRSLGVGAVLLALGLAAGPAASAADGGSPTPPIRYWGNLTPLLS